MNKLSNQILDVLISEAHKPIDQNWLRVSHELQRLHGPSARSVELIPGFPETSGGRLLHPSAGVHRLAEEDPSREGQQARQARLISRTISKLALDMTHATNDDGERTKFPRTTPNPRDGIYSSALEREMRSNISRGFDVNDAVDPGSKMAPVPFLNAKAGVP
jgi:hypothetical protein